jgi:hypothetical protein
VSGNSGVEQFEGLIDEVNIWNYVLEPYQIAELYIDVMTDTKICLADLGPEDLNGDCDINMTDFAMMAAKWLDCNIVPDCISSN